MNTTTYWEHSLVHQIWTKFKTWRHFKFVLPEIKYTILESVRLNLAGLPPLMKNNLMEGRYEVQERGLAAQFLDADDRVPELGSAIGFIGLYCQLRLGIREYAGVEANPATLQRAEANYRLNGLAPKLFHAAVAANDGIAQLHLHSDFWRDSVLDTDPAEEVTRVPAHTLGSIVGALAFEPTALIVDIEGAEQSIDWSELPASVRTVIIELHPEEIGYTATYRITDDLQRLGFSMAAEQDGTCAFIRP